jgi:hypothetical protein
MQTKCKLMQTKSDQPWYTKSQTQTKSTNHKGMRSSRQKYKNTSKRPNKTQTNRQPKTPKINSLLTNTTYVRSCEPKGVSFCNMLVPIQSPFCAFRFCSHDFFSTSNICWHTDSQTSFLVTCSSNLHLPETSQLLFSQQLQVKHPSNIVPNKFVYTLFAFCLQISYWSYHKQEIKKMAQKAKTWANSWN